MAPAPSHDEVCDRIERGVCPACLVDLEPALERSERVGAGLGVTHSAGDRLCPICGTGWRVWKSEVTGRRHYGQVGGVLGPRPQ